MDYMGKSNQGHVSGNKQIVEVTFDVHDDSIVLQSVALTNTATTQEDVEMMLVEADGLDRRSSAQSSSFAQSTTHRLKKFSQELKADASARVKQFWQQLKQFS